MILDDMIDALVEYCDPDGRVYVDCNGCVYEVIGIRVNDGEVILDAI